MPAVTSRGGPKMLWFETPVWANAGVATPIAVAAKQAAAIALATPDSRARVISHLPETGISVTQRAHKARIGTTRRRSEGPLPADDRRRRSALLSHPSSVSRGYSAASEACQGEM